MTEAQKGRPLTLAEWVEAKRLCKYCDLGWDLGRYGCHYEPMPDPADDEQGRMQAHCAAWGIRRITFYTVASSQNRGES